MTDPCLPECGVARFLALLNGPWATLIVRELLHGPHRFTELREALPGISPHTLTSRLRQFERHGIVTRTTYAEIPHKFEAGTPDIAGAVGLGAAVDYLQALGMERVARHERELLAYGTELLSAIPGLRIVGTARDKTGVLSFVLDGVHPHDIGTVLDQEGVAIRAGHHCAQPLMERFGLAATARASLGVYNTEDDLDRLAAAIRKVIEVFA